MQHRSGAGTSRCGSQKRRTAYTAALCARSRGRAPGCFLRAAGCVSIVVNSRRSAARVSGTARSARFHAKWLGNLGRRGQHERFTHWARELGLDTARFRACWKSEHWARQLVLNTQLARTNGVPGTPAFVVNGRPLVGDLPYSDFAAALEAAARSARQQ
ncbi:MAG: DsbA family protein [Longimicrobiales bacterium]